jgi:hypothetical protein
MFLVDVMTTVVMTKVEVTTAVVMTMGVTVTMEVTVTMRVTVTMTEMTAVRMCKTHLTGQFVVHPVHHLVQLYLQLHL